MEITKDKPLYQIIMDDIRQTISACDFDYDKPICTEKSICEKYNVSRITAKHAIKELESNGVLYRKRGVGSFVSRPDENTPPAETLASAAPYKVFALLVPFSITKGGIFRAIESASGIFTRRQCHLTFHISELSVNREKELLEQLYAQDVDGLVYYPWTSTLPIDVLNRFVEKNKPVIILDKACPYPQISSIVCDNYRGGYMLTEHLVSYGHKKTCYLSRFTPSALSSIHDRYNGYVDCLRENHIENPRFVHWDTSVQAGYPMLKHIVNTLYLEGITAILCENDEVAFNVYMCCRSLGIRIPDDMNITGFDNIEWATTGSAQITTMDQNFSRVGEAVAEIILQEDYAPCQRVIPVRLIPRTSTGKAVPKSFI